MRPSLPVRRSLARALAAAALATLATAVTTAPAQERPVVRVLVGFPPGAGTDSLARIYADALAERLKATVVVENRTGAGGQIAAQAMRQAPADSNTLMVAVDHQVVMLPLIMRNAGFDVKKDLLPVGRLTRFYTCLAVPASSPAQSLQAFVDAARRDPAAGNYGVPAPGSQAQFVGYVVAQHFKAPLNVVAYRGAAPAIADLIGGQVASAIVPCDALIEHRKAGRVRVLAMASDQRYAAMPDVPTFAELGVAMPGDTFLAAYAAASLRPELLRQVTDATRTLFDDPKVVERIAATGMEPAYASPEELARIVDRASVFWGDQVKRSGFQAQ